MNGLLHIARHMYTPLGQASCPRPEGNVATEDLVHALRRWGLRRDIDLEALVALGRDVSLHFGRELPGRVYKTGSLSY